MNRLAIKVISLVKRWKKNLKVKPFLLVKIYKDYPEEDAKLSLGKLQIDLYFLSSIFEETVRKNPRF
jgi:hypothetical protein